TFRVGHMGSNPENNEFHNLVFWTEAEYQAAMKNRKPKNCKPMSATHWHSKEVVHFASHEEAADKLKIKPSQISRALKSKTHRAGDWILTELESPTNKRQ